MKFSNRIQHNIAIISIEGPLTQLSIEEVTTYIKPFLENKDLKGIIYNLHHINTADSSGISAIVQSYKVLKSSDRKLVIILSNKFVLKMIHMLHLHEVIKIVSNEQEAFAHFLDQNKSN